MKSIVYPFNSCEGSPHCDRALICVQNLVVKNYVLPLSVTKRSHVQSAAAQVTPPFKAVNLPITHRTYNDRIR
jgi:hypothetical protein